MFVIWSFEHHAWWAPSREGYTEDLASAGLYSQREAGEIVTNSMWNDEVAIVVAIATREGPPKFHPYAGNDPNYRGG
jgi:hypothetical protein